MAYIRNCKPGVIARVMEGSGIGSNEPVVIITKQEFEKVEGQSWRDAHYNPQMLNWIPVKYTHGHRRGKVDSFPAGRLRIG